MCRGAEEQRSREKGSEFVHDRVGDHCKNHLLLRFVLVHDGEAFGELEFLVKQLGVLETRNNDFALVHPFLNCVAQELLSINRRHLQVHDQQIDLGSQCRERSQGIRVGFHLDELAIAFREKPDHSLAKEFVIIHNYNQLGIPRHASHCNMLGYCLCYNDRRGF